MVLALVAIVDFGNSTGNEERHVGIISKEKYDAVQA